MYDIRAFSNTPEEHWQHTENVLNVLYTAKLSKKLKKRSLCSKTKNHLGYIFAPGKPHVEIRTTESIKNLQ